MIFFSHQVNKGFRSLTLLSLLIDYSEYENGHLPDNWEKKSLKKCLKVLNDRRQVVLEPLHSLRRLTQTKRKRSIGETERVADYSRFQYLDLAMEIYTEDKEPLCPSYRVSIFPFEDNELCTVTITLRKISNACESAPLVSQNSF